ncbi:hypothetical protein AB6N24_18620 [Cellulomonas sp. 179-A 4D5 NHS]|uniref:hypothetical protein n=1 Tax=Cellulomonas sp. 179-A 4D5 NHS TaxID=3142378 RepID=UPI0039A0FD0B
MTSIDARAAGAGAVTGVVAYLVVTVTVLPLLAGSLLRAGGLLAAAVVLVLQVLALAGSGLVTALVMRRRRSTTTRPGAVPSAVAGGLAGAVVVLLLGSAAAAASASSGLGVGALVSTLLLWSVAPAVGALLVPPSHDPATRGYGAAARAASLRGDAGASTLETLGGATVAAILVVAVVAVVGPQGSWLGDNVRRGLCQVATAGQGDCGSRIPIDAERHRPTNACVLENSADRRNASVAVTFIAVKGGGTIRVERMSDDTYRVSAEGTGGIGVTEGLGGGVSVTVDDYIHGGEAQLSGSAYVEAAGGATWVVDEAGKEQLVDFLEEQRDWATLQAGLSGTGPVGGVAAGAAWAGKEVWDWITGDSYTPPAPDEVYGQAGIGGDGSASAAGIVNGAAVKGATATALGSRVNIRTGETTVYYTSTISGSAALTGHDPINSTQLQAGGEMKVMVAVTVDSEGNPVKVSTQALAVGDAKAFAENAFLGETFDEHPSGGSLLEASVELTGPETQRIALDLLGATGIIPPGTPAQRATSAYDAFTTFTGAARDRGVMTRQDVTLDTNTSFGIQAGGKVGPVALGGTFENSTSTVTSGDAYFFNGSGWQPWTECAA